ncbi:integrase core domain-containing protein, partial [Candidatus Saccharibacteria bacterium]|nr:integrase core domain-containing protein [Candidatus Saccharibacteria bacterium]
SEFYKHFIRACDERNIEQLWNYPKRPKNNGMVERFNRSIQEEFIDWNLDNLAYDLEDFNNSLMDWCIWYNTKRPHYGLGLKSPMQYLLEVLQLSQQESRMLWTDTTT